MKFITKFFIAVILLTSTNLLAKDRVVTVIFTGDVKGNVDTQGRRIGHAKLATYIKNKKAEDANVLYLDAGDTIHGEAFATLERGESIVDVLNAIGLDAMVAGNHEFDYGYKSLISIATKANFSLLSANSVYSTNNTPFLQASVVKTLPNGVKVGIFGITTPETSYKTRPEHIQGIKFLSPEVVAQEEVRKLKGQGVDIIIALSHLGIDDATAYENRASILANVSGVDLIVDAHGNTLLKEGRKIKSAFLVRAEEYTRTVGEVKITLTSGGNKFITQNSLTIKDFQDLEEDQDVVNVIRKHKASQDVILSEVIARTSVHLEGSEGIVRTRETKLGMITTDAMREVSGADIAFMNGGNMMHSITEGDITVGSLYLSFPFSTPVYTLRLSGLEVKEMLEFSVEALPSAKSGFLHVSGLTFKVDTTKPRGSRVSDIVVGQVPLANNGAYTVTTTDFIISGGDGYRMLRNKKPIASHSSLKYILNSYIRTVNFESYDFSQRITIVK